MLKVVIQLADFLLKAAAEYIKTAPGQKEWKDIEKAAEEMRQ